jgi:hypothetical protein
MKARTEGDLARRVQRILTDKLRAWDPRARFTMRTRSNGAVEARIDSPRFAAMKEFYGTHRADAELGFAEEFSRSDLRRIRLHFKSTT